MITLKELKEQVDYYKKALELSYNCWYKKNIQSDKAKNELAIYKKALELACNRFAYGNDELRKEYKKQFMQEAKSSLKRRNTK